MEGKEPQQPAGLSDDQSHPASSSQCNIYNPRLQLLPKVLQPCVSFGHFRKRIVFSKYCRRKGFRVCSMGLSGSCSDFGTEGWGFKSLRVYFSFLRVESDRSIPIHGNERQFDTVSTLRYAAFRPYGRHPDWASSGNGIVARGKHPKPHFHGF